MKKHLTFRTIDETKNSLRELRTAYAAQYVWVVMHGDGSGHISIGGGDEQEIATFVELAKLEITIESPKLTVKGGVLVA